MSLKNSEESIKEETINYIQTTEEYFKQQALYGLYLIKEEDEKLKKMEVLKLLNVPAINDYLFRRRAGAPIDETEEMLRERYHIEGSVEEELLLMSERVNKHMTTMDIKVEEDIHKKFGYKRLPESTEKEIQLITKKEKELIEIINSLTIPINQKWKEKAINDLECGFMCIRRAIARP